jgi:hypothetical protein
MIVVSRASQEGDLHSIRASAPPRSTGTVLDDSTPAQWLGV